MNLCRAEEKHDEGEGGVNADEREEEAEAEQVDEEEKVDAEEEVRALLALSSSQKKACRSRGLKPVAVHSSCHCKPFRACLGNLCCCHVFAWSSESPGGNRHFDRPSSLGENRNTEMVCGGRLDAEVALCGHSER